MDNALGNAAALENKSCKDKERDGDGNGDWCPEKKKSKEAEKKYYANFSLPP